MSKSKSIAKQDDYTPTPQEQALLESYIAKTKEKPPPPRMTVTRQAGRQVLDNDHQDPNIGQVQLMAALGTQDPSFCGGPRRYSALRGHART